MCCKLQRITMPCSRCRQPGHNASTCKQRIVFTYIDDEGSRNPITRENGLEDWMKPDEILEDFFYGYEDEIWNALHEADEGDGLIYEEVIQIVRNVCNRPRRKVNLDPHPPVPDGRNPLPVPHVP